MQFSHNIIISIAATLASLAAAAPVEPVAPKIDFTIKRLSSADKASSIASKTGFRTSRAASSAGVNLNLKNEYALYLAEIEVGTPGQKIQVDVDTGSSDLWVPGAGTQSDYGTYDHTKSSTYKYDKSGFAIGYGDGSSARGDWAKETVTIGGVEIKDLEFGDATTQDAGMSILGVGLKGNEASAQSRSPFTYDNLPLQMKAQGIINKAAYSLYLNSLEATSGSILFGAIDKSKFSGDLKTLKLQNVDDSGSPTDEPVAFFVNLDSITAADNQFVTKSYPALLDSGTTLIYAPKTVAAAIGKKYGTYSQQAGGYLTSCSTKGDDFSFTFEDKTITVPFKDLLFKEDDKNPDLCLIGVLESGDDYYILGDGFLRSTYVYYNIEDNEVGIAQAKYNDSKSQIVLSA